MKATRVAVVGATGLVGRELLTLLAERHAEIGQLLAFDSERAEGEEVDWEDGFLKVRRLPRELPPVEVLFLCATTDVSRDLAPEAAEAGALVIDLTPAFRDDPDVPLVMAGQDRPPIAARPGGLIVAVPDPVTLALVTVLRPLAERAGLRRVVATALCSASAEGRESVERLARSSACLLGGGGDMTADVAEDLAFNCFPADGVDGAAAAAIESQVRRMLGTDIEVAIHLTRIPSFHGQGLTISAGMKKTLPLPELREVLGNAPSLRVGDDMPGTRDVVGSDAVHVTAIRVAEEADGGRIHCWAASDNLRQGAALHAIRIAESWQGAGPEGN